MSTNTHDLVQDPVAAYDRVAPVFSRLADQRRAYLDKVDALIIDAIPRGGGSLLDVGSGDGTRARHIFEAAGLTRLVMLEPSPGMRKGAPVSADVLAIRAESLHEQQTRFDVVTCLWNVLGHIFPVSNRIEVLRQFARLIAPGGRIFIDVNHRYNARHYGAWTTALRLLRDRLFPNETNGDVVVTWDLGGVPCRTAGHVFTHGEFARLCSVAGLKIRNRFVVDYGSGELRRWSFSGNLLYELRAA